MSDKHFDFSTYKIVIVSFFLFRFTKIAFECLEKVLEYRCGPEANNFLFNVMTGLLPTECQETGSATIHLPSGWTLLLISLANVFLYVAEQS